MSAALTKTTHRFFGSSGLLVSKLALGSWMQCDEKYTVDMCREDLVIFTKLFFGYKDMATAGPNDQGNTRKHILEGVQASLRFLELEYVDVIFCHRPDPFTQIKETVRAMNYVINKGWAFYWGTSESPPSQIHEACEIADRLNQIRRSTTSSSAQMLRKYSAGTPDGSRFTTPQFSSGPFRTDFEERVKIADKLKPSAEELGCYYRNCRSPGLFRTKTCRRYKITPELKAKIDAIDNFVPTVPEIHPFAFARSRFL
ncbi:hypothetical protein PC120_g9633 [Phytophthora cactorum]|nr:hypothetical protein PC120_g9633 [Phytophthora cactorum]